MRPARSTSLLCLALVLSACATEPAPVDAGSDAAWIECAPVPCGPRGYVCREARIFRRLGSLVSRCDPAGRACEEVEHEEQCELGCVEGATALDAAALCAWREPGDPCAEQADCEPRPGPALRCDVANGVCIVPGPEVCNGLDDDGDGVTDPACRPPPPTLARLPLEGVAERIAFGPDRIALLSSDVVGTRIVQVVDGDGALVATHRLSGTPRALAYIEGELVVMLREGIEGPVLVRLRDDGTRSAVTLALAVPAEPLSLSGDPDGWTLAAPLASGAIGITRHAPSGERLAMRRHDGAFGVSFLVRTGTTTWIGLSAEVPLARVTPSLELEPAGWHESISATWGQRAYGDQLVALGVTFENQLVLVRLDAAGAPSVPRPLETTAGDFRQRFALDASDTEIWLAAAVDGAIEIEGLRLDDGGSIARFAVHRWSGVVDVGTPRDDGVRLVVGYQREWGIHALRATP